MHTALRGRDIHKNTPVVVPRDALPEIVILHLTTGECRVSEVVAAPFPVDLVEDVGDEDGGGYDAGAGGALEIDVDASVVDVEICPELGGVARFGDGEGCALVGGVVVYGCVV